MTFNIKLGELVDSKPTKKINPIDTLLKSVTDDDLPDYIQIHSDYLKGIEFDKLKKEDFYIGDGLDFFRYFMKYSDGIPLKSIKINRMQSVVVKYIKKRLITDPSISVYQLCKELTLDERTVRRYFLKIKNSK